MSSALIRPHDAAKPSSFPPFQPHPWFPGPHAQTLAGVYWPSGWLRLPSRSWQVPMPDGDAILVEDSIPSGWNPGDPAAVLLHGLGGCSRASYVVRFGMRLYERGVRVVRMNLRSAGQGFGLARKTYHAGSTDDVRGVIETLAAGAMASPIALVGFSIGANLALKLASEAAGDPVRSLDCVLAANPPVDLSLCSQAILKPENHRYHRNFLSSLVRQVEKLHQHFPDLGPTGLAGVKTLWEFDNLYVAPRNGFRDAEDYYAQSSAGPMLGRVALPGVIVHALDDPFIPAESFDNLEVSSTLEMELVPFGGHLGYVSRRIDGGGSRWLDSRLITWLENHWKRT